MGQLASIGTLAGPKPKKFRQGNLFLHGRVFEALEEVVNKTIKFATLLLP